MATGETVHISNLSFDPKNARRRTERSSRVIRQSLEKFGGMRSIVIDDQNVVRAGNGTLEEAGQIGIEKVRIVEADGNELIAVKRKGLTEEQWKEYAVTDNRSSDLSEWDAEILSELNQEVDLSGLFNKDELAEILDELNTTEVLPEDEDAVEDLVDQAESGVIESRVSLGQIWRLGRHYIACGDSTDEANIRGLMKIAGVEAIDMVWTDPPYGVAYEGKTKDKMTIENDRLSSSALYDFLIKVFSAIVFTSNPGSPVYVAHPANELHNVFFKAMVDSGLIFKQTLIWVKNTFAMGRSDYHYQHEPIYYAHTPGRKVSRMGGEGWFGGHNQTSTFFFDKPSANRLHPTMKPVELIIAMVQNSSFSNACLLEPFLGSGSTLIAAQQMEGDRKVIGFELSPEYCEVICQRFTRLTGVEPVLAGNL